MTKHSSFISLAALELDASAATPLYRQLYDQMRDAILARRLAAGLRLPPSRALADDLSVSRNTVVNAFEQLTAEGYIAGKVGSGTFVAQTLPDEMLHLRRRLPRPVRTVPHTRMLSTRGRLITASADGTQTDASEARAFRPSLPALDRFPRDVWARLSARRWRQASSDLLGYGDAAGYTPLREAIANYLASARGVQCAPEQVIVVAGSQQAIDLAARILLDRDDALWIEEPGYLGARAVFVGVGARLVPVPVDAQGLDVRAGMSRAPDARMVYVSPSHQFPLGVSMSLARRLALLDWAARTGAWIIEDDYDSEYRFVGRPLAALQGLDRVGRVIYVGTFSEVLLPSLRLGYMVVPPQLVETFVSARALADRHSPLVEQAVVADFMNEGHFARHIRHMRTLYAERRTLLIEAIERELGDTLEINGDAAGMHLLAWLPHGVNDKLLSKRLRQRGIEAPALSQYALAPLRRHGLVLGYAGFSAKQLRDGAHLLQAVLKSD